MIKVWADGAEAGLLDRHGARASTFAYLPGAPSSRAVSVTMPVRLPSWSATKQHRQFAEIGARMLEAWESGVNTCL